MDVSARLDRLPLSRFHWLLLFTAGMGWAFDSMDVGLLSFVLPSLRNEWKLDPQTSGLIISVTLLGLFFGASFAGWLADRYGRKLVFQLTLLIYAIGTGLSGLAWNLASLFLFRFVTGVGLGGELPVAATLVSEYSPSRVRGRMIVILESFWAYGWILAAVIGYFVSPYVWAGISGWRVAFLIGALPALWVIVIRRVVPESVRWLASVGRRDEAERILSRLEGEAGQAAPKPVTGGSSEIVPRGRARFAELWTGPYLRRTIMLWILWFGIVFSYYGVFTWLPTLLVDRGLTIVRAFEYVLYITLAQVPGYFSAAYLVEVIGRRWTLVIYLAGSAVSAWFLGSAGTASEIILWGCLLSFFNLGAWGVVYTYTPELYPTWMRASGSGWAAAFGRIAGIIAPYAVGVLLPVFGGPKAGQPAVFAIFMAFFAIIALDVLILGEETKGKRLEEIAG